MPVILKTPLIWFSRHGETAWNAEGRVQGQYDTDLNALGKVQANANGIKLKSLISEPDQFDFVSSPLKRTRDTMQRIRNQMGLAPLDYSLEDRLKEVHFGDWQGFTLDEISLVSPLLLEERSRDKWNFLPPGSDAESYEILCKRFTQWLSVVEKPTVCVTHGGIVRCLFHLMKNMDGEMASRLSVPQDQVLRLENGELKWF